MTISLMTLTMKPRKMTAKRLPMAKRVKLAMGVPSVHGAGAVGAIVAMMISLALKVPRTRR